MAGNWRRPFSSAAQGSRCFTPRANTDNAIVHDGHLDPGVTLLRKPYRKSDLAQKIREVLAKRLAVGIAIGDP